MEFDSENTIFKLFLFLEIAQSTRFNVNLQKITVKTSTSSKPILKEPLLLKQYREFSRRLDIATLTNVDSSCPESILKTTLLPPGYSLVSGGWHVTPKAIYSGLVLDHQGLE